MDRRASITLGVVVERREIDNPWQDHAWRAIALVPGAPERTEWQEMVRGDGWVRYHAGTLPLMLHRADTEAYKVNLANAQPVVYVVLRPSEGVGPADLRLFDVTASAYEAQTYLDGGEDIVEPVPMPEGLLAWVQSFIDTHHVDEPFHKRKRKKHKAERPPDGPPRLADGRHRGRAGPNG